MRKNYVKPAGNKVLLRMDENIALSLGFIDTIYEFTLQYTFRNNGKFIKDTQLAASNTGWGSEVDATRDLLKLVDAIVDSVDAGLSFTGYENCNANTGASTAAAMTVPV